MLLCGFTHCWYSLFCNTCAYKIHSIKPPSHILWLWLCHIRCQGCTQCLCSNWDQIETNPSFLLDSLVCVVKIRYDLLWNDSIELPEPSLTILSPCTLEPGPCVDPPLILTAMHQLQAVLLTTPLLHSAVTLETYFVAWTHTQQDIHTVWQRLHRSDFMNRLLTLHFGLVWRVLLCLDFEKF